MDCYKKAKAMLLSNDSEVDLNGAVSLDELKQAEESLNIKFPLSFSVFLQELGGGDIGGEVIFGLSNSYKDENLVDINKDLREKGLNHNYIVISKLDTLYYCLDLSLMDVNKECPVIVIDEDFNKMDKIAVSFGEFLYMFLSQYYLEEIF